jgi:non-ribosomal peptide synthetase-like protein
VRGVGSGPTFRVASTRALGLVGPRATQAAVLLGGPAAAPRTLMDILRDTEARYPREAAIDDGRRVLDYRTLWREVGVLSTRLRASGVGHGDRVGIRVESGTAELYVSILAVLAVGAAYVPVDVDDPAERADLVWREAGICAFVDSGAAVRPGPARPRGVGPRWPAPSDDAWIIFTSGSTGTPKGVAVTHRSAAAFVDAEAGLFAPDRPLGPGDRVLAGLSVAFDASCEEMWLAWRSGACLVPAARVLVKSGAELGDWLLEQRISVVSTVPTLAGLWSAEQLRGVRLLILGGEACPPPLAAQLARACPEVWNTYGPTEATVVATAARLTVDGPVRIGQPLDGWQVAVVDPSDGRPLGWDEPGELVIAGVGTARYLDPAKDAAKFAALPALNWPRAYRSGDLVTASPEGVSYLGRIDSQVKIRGFRIELSEIESVLATLPGIAQAAVTTHQPRPGETELAAYYTPSPGAAPDPRRIHLELRSRLPAHMVPAYLDELAVIPTMTSGKLDRSRLPAPGARCRPGGSDEHVAPRTHLEAALAEALAEVLDLDEVSVESHFFDELGISSLTMAHFCTGVRGRPGLPPVAMKDIYQHPTVRSLAGALAAEGPAEAAPPPERPPVPPVGRGSYLLCGTGQAVLLAAMAYAGALALVLGLRWIAAAPPLAGYGRAAGFTAATFLVSCAVPVLAKWTLIGRRWPAEIRLWSLAYLRFWVVKTLVRACPLALFAGSPVYLLYLRALGARIGPGAVILSRTVPVCTDLLSIGAGTVVRKGCSFAGYRAAGGVIEFGAVSLGRDVVVGESTVLEIGTALGDGAQLGHASALRTGQRVPDGERWHGSPAEPTGTDYRRVPAARCGRMRRTLFGAAQLANLLLGVPLLLTVADLVAPRVRTPLDLDALGTTPAATLAGSLAWAGVLLFGGTALGLLLVVTVPRLLRALLTTGRAYPLYGPAYWVYRAIARATTRPFFVRLYGDSSYIVGYLRALGYRADPAGQTGSNFGAEVSHETPYLVSVGAGTMVSDGVGFLTAEFSPTSFRVSPVTVGSRCFLGNSLSVPSGARLGDDCFVGTKTMLPIDGRTREKVGLLGSPPFEIPRNPSHDHRFDLTRTEFRRRLAAKNSHNLRTIALFMLAQWTRLTVDLLLGLEVLHLSLVWGPAAAGLAGVVIPVGDALWNVLIERAVTGFRALRPRYCSIYDPYFWWHERFWKLSTQPAFLNGTAVKGMVWRLLGARVGRRLFDDGCGISEKSLVVLGDDVALNTGSMLQAHSMEDGVFKADHIVVESGASLGAGAFVHYGVTIGAGARLGSDSFLMKGEQMPQGSRWHGNPAREIR